ncbi:MAG TPA: hypothetical protein VKB31_01770 [Trueperaceae bacterium]|nr:hypothetical protein [Trueperaceae bacterium]
MIAKVVFPCVTGRAEARVEGVIVQLEARAGLGVVPDRAGGYARLSSTTPSGREGTCRVPGPV